MKRFILFVLSIASFSAAHAQNFTNTGSGVNKIDTRDEEETSGPSRSEPARVVYASPYSMEYTTMDIQENSIRFDNLPDIAMTLHVTDAGGNEVITRKLSRKNNTASISRLKKGMHFVTLISDNTNSRKSFTLNRN